MIKAAITVVVCFLLLDGLFKPVNRREAIAADLAAKTIGAGQVQPGIINPFLAKICYMGDERFQFDVHWSGGIKIGEIYLEISKSEQCEDCFEISSRITSKGGVVHHLYPIEDVHTTIVSGDERLPIYGEIWQKQGRNYTAHKIIHYDQQNHIIVKQKEGDPAKSFQVDGVVHNEFSSFFSSRIMNLEAGKPISVATFGDDKRHEVIVVTEENGIIKKSLFGKVKTLKVSPILTFSGLYDKKGDTIIWYTDDECRVPVLIKSKIKIGTLTASLAQYQNPACGRYSN